MFGLSTEEGDPRVHLFRVPLRGVGACPPLTIRVESQFLKVSELCDKARRKDGQGLLREGRIPLGRVDQLSTGSISEFDLRGDAVREGKSTADRPEGLSA